MTFEKWHFELNNKWNKLIKGFPGLLNTIRTLLDRSQTMKQILKKSQNTKGPMTPGNFGAETIKLFKSLKIVKSSFFLNMEKMRTTFWEGSTERELQIIDMIILGANCVLENLWTSAKINKIGSILGTSQMVLKNFRNLLIFWNFWVRAVCLTTRLRKAKG